MYKSFLENCQEFLARGKERFSITRGREGEGGGAVKIVKIVAKGFVRLKSCKSSPIVRQFLQRATLYTCIESMTWKGSLETSFQKLQNRFLQSKDLFSHNGRKGTFEGIFNCIHFVDIRYFS